MSLRHFGQSMDRGWLEVISLPGGVFKVGDSFHKKNYLPPLSCPDEFKNTESVKGYKKRMPQPVAHPFRMFN